MKKLKHFLFDTLLPIYFPKSAQAAEDRIFLAIWNCGKRPQTFWQAVKDIRITIRRGVDVLYVIKKGNI